MILDPAQYRARLPLPATDKWPNGVRDVLALERHGLALSLFAPKDVDHQVAHGRDELYFIVGGCATLHQDSADPANMSPGLVAFVPAHRRHRFTDISDDFVTWVVFFGPEADQAER